MGLMQQVIRSLLPSRFIGTAKSLIDSIGLSVQTARDYLRGIVTQAIPSGATTTLQAWYEMLGLSYDATLTTRHLQAQARQAWIGSGGTLIAALRNTIQIAFPMVDIETVAQYFNIESMAGAGMAGLMQATDYPAWYTPTGAGEYPIHYFFVVGEVEDVWQFTRLDGFLDRVKPAHMEAVYDVDILNATGTAQAGLGMSGLMEAGRE